MSKEPVSRHSYRWHLGCILLKIPAMSLPTGVLVRSKLFFLLNSSVIFNSASNTGATAISAFVLQRSYGFTPEDVGILVIALGLAVIFVQAVRPLSQRTTFA